MEHLSRFETPIGVNLCEIDALCSFNTCNLFQFPIGLPITCLGQEIVPNLKYHYEFHIFFFHLPDTSQQFIKNLFRLHLIVCCCFKLVSFSVFR